MSECILRRKLLPAGIRKAVDVLQVWYTVKVVSLSGEGGREREMTEAISPQLSAGWGQTCWLEEATVWLLPELCTERCESHQTHQEPHNSGPREGFIPKSVTQYCALSLWCTTSFSSYENLTQKPLNFSAVWVSISTQIPSTVGVGVCQGGLKWERGRVPLGSWDCLRTLLAGGSMCAVKQGLRWMETPLLSPHPCPSSTPSRRVPAALGWPALQERARISSSWRRDSCCLSHHRNWGPCLFCKCCQLCKCCNHHSKGLLALWSPSRIPKYVFPSFCSIKSTSK